MTPVVKPAPKKKPNARAALTIRLSVDTLREIEKHAARQAKSSRTLLREMIEEKFSGAPKLSL